MLPLLSVRNMSCSVVSRRLKTGLRTGIKAGSISNVRLIIFLPTQLPCIFLMNLELESERGSVDYLDPDQSEGSGTVQGLRGGLQAAQERLVSPPGAHLQMPLAKITNMPAFFSCFLELSTSKWRIKYILVIIKSYRATPHAPTLPRSSNH